MNKIFVLLLLASLLSCSENVKNTNGTLIGEQFIRDQGYTIVKSEGKIFEHVLERKDLLEMPHIQEWSVQTTDPSSYIGKMIVFEKYLVKNHPLDRANGNESKQTIIILMTCDDQVIGGYSFPNFREAHVGWTYSLDGKTLEELTGLSYSERSVEREIQIGSIH